MNAEYMIWLSGILKIRGKTETLTRSFFLACNFDQSENTSEYMGFVNSVKRALKLRFFEHEKIVKKDSFAASQE
jgi:hypothetical protein